VKSKVLKSLKPAIIGLLALILLYPTAVIGAPDPILVGRWEIVHTSGDNAAQTAYGPGNFSTFLRPDGTGYTYGTFSDSSLCVLDSETFNQVPSWIDLGGNNFQITIAVNGLGQNFSFIYTGLFNAMTSVPGSSGGLSIPAITGTYYAVGDASACSITTKESPGSFVATFLPTISDGSALGSLDGFSADNGSAFDSTVNAIINFTTPPAPGQLAGTVLLSPDAMFHHNTCFAATSSVTDPLTVITDPLTLNSGKSFQSGIFEYIFADGLDPSGVPTTLFLNSFSANLYVTPPPNTDPHAAQITTTEWAIPAAIGEDNPLAGPTGVNSDGTNSTMVMFYGVIGGVCDGAGGVDGPFHFTSGKPVSHRPKPIWHHRFREPHDQSERKLEQHQPQNL
jgi:hypothetical protein